MGWRESIRHLKGLARRAPFVAAAMALCLTALPAGTPAVAQDADTQLHPFVPTPAKTAKAVKLRPKPAATPTAQVAPAPAVATTNRNGPIPYQVLRPTLVTPPKPAPKPSAPKPVAPPPVQPASGPAQTAPISPDDIESFTDSVVRTLMQRDHVLGATVAVVQGSTPLLVKGYGYDRLSPLRRVDPNASEFRIGSVTKAFTWIVARQEMEAGRIKPDASIGNYLPIDLYSEDRRFKPITFRALMNHSPGYEDTSLGHLLVLDQTRLEDPDSYLRHRQPHRVRQPDQFSSYSNYGAALAARALQQTSKAQDVPTLMVARIFQPMGMDHTSLREPYSASVKDTIGLPDPMPANLVRDLSDGFVWDGATYEAQPFDHAIDMSGAVGGTSTAKDMARLIALMLNNGQLDGVQLYDAGSANAFRKAGLNMPEGYNGWASGLMVRQAPAGFTTYGHGGATLWFNSNLVLVPEMNLGIFIATNTQTGGSLAAAYPNLLLDHLTGDLIRPPLMPQAGQSYDDHKGFYSAISGEYVSTRRAYGGLEGAVTRLLNTVEITVDRDGRLILTTESGLSAFVPASAQGFFTQQDAEDSGPAQETGGLHFLMVGGRAKAFETQTNLARYERVGWWLSPHTLNVLTFLVVLSCVLVWLFLVRPRPRHEHPTEPQTAATFVSLGLSLMWLLAVVLFWLWRNGVADDPGALFTRWPSTLVRSASWLACLATLGTIYQLATTYRVFAEGRMNDGWPFWQKAAHAGLMAFWLVYALILMLWGALNPFS